MLLGWLYAGIRQTKETIEILGIERTFEKIRSASIVVLMLDADRPDGFEDSIKQLKANVDDMNQKVVIIINKIDLQPLTESKTTLFSQINEISQEWD